MYNLEMNNLELLLRKYANNFVLSDNIINDDKIECLKFRNIVIVTDSNLVKDSENLNHCEEYHLMISLILRGQWNNGLLLIGNLGKQFHTCFQTFSSILIYK